MKIGPVSIRILTTPLKMATPVNARLLAASAALMRELAPFVLGF
jgi:hypothetical protein